MSPCLSVLVQFHCDFTEAFIMFLLFALFLWYSLEPLTIYVLSKIKIDKHFNFQPKLTIFTAAKIHSLLHRRVKYSNKISEEILHFKTFH